MKKPAAIVMLALAALTHGGEVKLAWNAQADATSFRVWKGIECLATVTEPQAAVTLPDAPAVLTVTARNAAGESTHSAPLEVVALTVEESMDLKTWAAARTFYRERKAMAFYRLKLQTGGQP